MCNFYKAEDIVKYMSVLMIWLFLTSCQFPKNEEQRKVLPKTKVEDYIKPILGKNDSIPESVISKGKVLISYDDCYTCHKEDKRSFGPAFTDIAKRYPANAVYIKILAQKVILGGTGAWGNAVMLSHPKLSSADAENMVSYILSLK